MPSCPTTSTASNRRNATSSQQLYRWSQPLPQVVQVCAEHKKPAKLTKHLQQIKDASRGLRNPPRILIFANR